MNKEYILFDLDGTVADSSQGIFDCVRYALSHFGVDEPDNEKLRHFVGPPLTKGFVDHCPNLSEEDVDFCVLKYREKYKTDGVYSCKAYEGIEELFKKLTELGRKIYISTLKPEPFAKIMIEHLGLSKYVQGVHGVDFKGEIHDKCSVIKNTLKEHNITDLEKCVMIGDRKSDAIGAMQAGIDAIGVLFGFGGEDEFSDLEIWQIAQEVSDLEKILIKNT